MSLGYQKRSAEELEQLAEIVFNRYAHRCNGCYIDVEGILEDCGLTIIPREGGLGKLVHGYVATNPHYVVISETLSSYAPRYRPVVAEELCHAILEYDFLMQGKLPDDAQPHALTSEEHTEIESAAQYLARAVLFPRGEFRKIFEHFMKNSPQDVSEDRGKLLRYCAEQLENQFQVWSLIVAYRARDLKLITEGECSANFSSRLTL